MNMISNFARLRRISDSVGFGYEQSRLDTHLETSKERGLGISFSNIRFGLVDEMLSIEVKSALEYAPKRYLYYKLIGSIR